MAINDFAGPIINAFLSGQQMRRQSEQDALAQEERQARLKQQEVELKRLEKQDAMQLALARMQIEDRLRAQVASGQRAIPTVGMDAPGGVKAPAMNPLAQQMLAPSDVQELPLQNIPGQTAPVQLGSEFAIPETNRVQDPIVRIPEFGEFDLRGMPGPEEVLEQELLKRRALRGEKVAETELIEGIKTKNRLQVQTASDTAAMNRTQVTAGVQRERNQVLAQNQKAALAFKDKQLNAQMKNWETANNLALQRLNLARARAAASDAKDARNEEDFTASTLADLAERKLTREDLLQRLPASRREPILAEARKQKIDIFSRKDIDSIAQLTRMSSFLEEIQTLAKSIDDNKVIGSLPFTETAAREAELRSRLEEFGRDVRRMKGVFSDKDVERLTGALPTRDFNLSRSAVNTVRVNKIIQEMKTAFKTEFGKLQPMKQVELLKETGMARYFEEK